MTTIQSHRPTAETVPDLGAGLLARLHAGDRAAFGDLFLLTAHRLTRYVAARLASRDRDAVDGLVQKAFCTALADPRLLGADLFGSMLRLAACAVTAHHWSQRRYLRAAYTVYEDRTSEPAPTVSPEMLRRPVFAHALARLTPLQRRVVQLRYVDGYPRDYTAAAMGRTANAVRCLEYAALRRLYAECATTPA